MRTSISFFLFLSLTRIIPEVKEDFLMFLFAVAITLMALLQDLKELNRK